MNLGDVMEEVGDRLDTIDGLRVYRYPADDVAVPAAIVSLPEAYQYDLTGGRGSDRITLPVVVLVGAVSDRASRSQIGAYADGSGVRSVKQTLEAATPTAYDTVRVTGVEFDRIAMAGTEYLAATFTLDIAGTGA